jgi:hypothetical protein
MRKFPFGGNVNLCKMGHIFTEGEGGGGQREGTVWRGNSTQVPYSSFVHVGNSSQAGSKIQTMSECISSL